MRCGNYILLLLVLVLGLADLLARLQLGSAVVADAVVAVPPYEYERFPFKRKTRWVSWVCNLMYQNNTDHGARSEA